MYIKDEHHQIHYRTDIRHFESRTWNDHTLFAAKQANAILFGGFTALKHIKPEKTQKELYAIDEAALLQHYLT